MRNLLILLSFSLSFVLNAHEFYFAFAELEFNEVENRFELTVTATTHDVQRSLSDKGLFSSENVWQSTNLELSGIIEREMNRHLFLSVNESQYRSEFKLEGFESELTGITRFYLSCSAPNVEFYSVNVFFDLLMESFPEQQNKLTFIYRGKKQTFAFLQSTKSHLITLN